MERRRWFLQKIRKPFLTSNYEASNYPFTNEAKPFLGNVARYRCLRVVFSTVVRGRHSSKDLYSTVKTLLSKEYRGKFRLFSLCDLENFVRCYIYTSVWTKYTSFPINNNKCHWFVGTFHVLWFNECTNIYFHIPNYWINTFQLPGDHFGEE